MILESDMLRRQSVFIFVVTLIALCAWGGYETTAQEAGGKPVRPGTDSKRQLTSPPDRDEFSVAIFGDRTGGPRAGLKILEEGIRMANHLDVTFVMTVGDLINGYGGEVAWRLEAAEYKGLMSKLKMPWYPVAGNHDVYSRPEKEGGHTGLYKEQFGPLYYSFDYKWAHFIALYSDEALAFHNPAKNQNMSPEQLAWLRDDLAKTEASQIFVFLHHPRWNYKGCNWPEVHEVLAADGRVEAVIAGHIHTYRDDGVRDGIHYYAMAITGGGQGSLKDSAHIHHINHLRILPDRWTMAVLPVGNIYGGDFVKGTEVDAMRRLFRGLTLSGTGTIHSNAAREFDIEATLSNPTDRRLPYKIDVTLPTGWALRSPLPTDHGEIAPGEELDFALPLRVECLYETAAQLPEVRTTLHYPLESGLRQEIVLKADVPVQITGLSDVAGPRPKNCVLSLDGKSAIRVPLSDVLRGVDAFTVECWVRGKEPEGRMSLLSKTESSGFGIFWAPGGSNTGGPAGYAHVSGHGYIRAQPTEGWAWNEWTHVAVSYDGHTLRFFTNGQQTATTTQAGNLTENHHPLYVGADTNSRGRATSHFKGAIDDVRISRRARYTTSFTPPHVHEHDHDTLLLLHFDHGVRGFHPDASSHETHGWSVGNPKLLLEERPPISTKNEKF